MTSIPKVPMLFGRSVLLSPNEPQSDLTTRLQRYGARILAWPTLEIGEPGDYARLDEAMENLFGYDCLIFQNADAVDFFLRRFESLGHEISELDALRVCGASQSAVQTLEQSQVHIDIIPDGPSFRTLFEAIETYFGGREAIRSLNFLIPSAAIHRNGLQQLIEEAGARTDTVTAYRTAAYGDASLAQLNAVLAGGGIDCIIFNSSLDVVHFSRLFGSNDLAQLLAGVTVASTDANATKTAVDFGLAVHCTAADIEAITDTICLHFEKPSTQTS
jgi:uroporphyrinogen III methyltransferase/synthase